MLVAPKKRLNVANLIVFVANLIVFASRKKWATNDPAAVMEVRLELSPVEENGLNDLRPATLRGLQPLNCKRPPLGDYT
jgi:hypothetical protein